MQSLVCSIFNIISPSHLFTTLGWPPDQRNDAWLRVRKMLEMTGMCAKYGPSCGQMMFLLCSVYAALRSNICNYYKHILIHNISCKCLISGDIRWEVVPKVLEDFCGSLIVSDMMQKLCLYKSEMFKCCRVYSCFVGQYWHSQDKIRGFSFWIVFVAAVKSSCW